MKFLVLLLALTLPLSASPVNSNTKTKSKTGRYKMVDFESGKLNQKNKTPWWKKAERFVLTFGSLGLFFLFPKGQIDFRGEGTNVKVQK